MLTSGYPDSYIEGHPRAAQIQHLRSLCDGLGMDALRAAQYIYQELHDKVSAPTRPAFEDFSYQTK